MVNNFKWKVKPTINILENISHSPKNPYERIVYYSTIEDLIVKSGFVNI